MTPTQALEILRQTQGYRENLTQRSMGLSALVWAIVLPLSLVASAGLEAAYMFTHERDYSRTIDTLLAFVWVPFVALGVLISSLIAKDRAIQQGRVIRTSAFWIAAGCTIVFLAAFVVLINLVPALQPPVGGGLVTILAGIYLVGKGIWMRFSRLRGWWLPIVLAVALQATTVVLATVSFLLNGEHGYWAMLVAAIGICIAWTTHGLSMYLRG